MRTPLVFLHPLGADLNFWTEVRAELGGRDHIAFDLPGHGSAATLPRGAGVAAFADAVVGRLDPGTTVHLVGMSLGGIVAQQIALDRPDLVASVVLVDTVPVYPEPMRRMWRDRAAVARRGELKSLVEPMVEMWFTPEFGAAGDARVMRAREVFAGTDPEGYARACDLLAEVDLSDPLGALQVPVVVVCGRDDAQPFRDAAIRMARATGAGTVNWLPGRHACVAESPRQFADLLEAQLLTPGP
ncbi:alpha/beta fold hydrolase [Mycolicibacterium goodii]|uniref:alpha/beta fold hydrolase n=1 Tax=Mycolicibacterium goodii TaxID=134601 RepID=UPI000673AF5B